MIAITFALPEESKDLRRAWRETSAVGGGRERVRKGTLDGREVLLAHAGVGLEAAEKSARRLLGVHRPDLLICAGYGGGLDSRLRSGDVVIDWREREVALDGKALTARVFSGAIASGPRVLETPAEKAAFARESGALAVDMETSAVATVCAEHGVPLIGVRAISDAADEALPVPMRHWFNLRRQRPRPVALVLFLARHPRRIAPFARFVRGLPRARAALTEAVMAVVRLPGTKPFPN